MAVMYLNCHGVADNYFAREVERILCSAVLPQPPVPGPMGMALTLKGNPGSGCFMWTSWPPRFNKLDRFVSRDRNPLAEAMVSLAPWNHYSLIYAKASSRANIPHWHSSYCGLLLPPYVENLVYEQRLQKCVLLPGE